MDGVDALPILMTARHLRAARARAGQRPRRRAAAARAHSRGHGPALRQALGRRARAGGGQLRLGLYREHARATIRSLTHMKPCTTLSPVPIPVLASSHGALGSAHGGVHALSTRARS